MIARTTLTAMLIASGLGLAATSGSPAAPVARIEGAAAATTNDTIQVRYVRRHGRTCYRKCYREFGVFGRRICRTYC